MGVGVGGRAGKTEQELQRGWRKFLEVIGVFTLMVVVQVSQVYRYGQTYQMCAL